MWLNNFLCERDLKKPNGSPLYTYQVSDSEFNELKNIFTICRSVRQRKLYFTSTILSVLFRMVSQVL